MSFKNQTAITKIRAIYGKMLKEKEYLSLLNCNNIKEIISFLKNTAQYKNSFETIDKLNPDASQLENLIRKEAFSKYAKVYRFANKNKVVEFFIKNLEVDEILKIILLIKEHLTKKYFVFLPTYLVSKSKVDFYKLVNIENFDDLLNILKNTKYKKIISDIIKKDIDTSYLEFEYILYKNFFKGLLKTIKSETKNMELFELNKLLKTKIDNINTCYIYREKTIFNSEKEKIKEKIFPFHKNLKKEDLEKCLNSQNKAQLEEGLKKVYSKTKNLNIDKIENILKNLEYKMCSHYINISLNLTTVFYCFYILQQIEIKNLIHIIEGVRYNLNRDEIKNFLII